MKDHLRHISDFGELLEITSNDNSMAFLHLNLDAVFKMLHSIELKISNTHGHHFQRSVIPNIKF